MQTPVTHSPPLDLPPRTWRGWWLAWPKWFRIGCWAALGLIVLHVALAARIAVGWIEGAELTELRERGGVFSFSWDRRRQWFEGQRLLMAGLLGRSGANVAIISFQPPPDDTDLNFMGVHFPNVTYLSLQQAEISKAGISALRGCRKLEGIELNDSTVDDQAAVHFAEFRRLKYLDLSHSLITDAALPIFQSLPALEDLRIEFTDATPAGVKLWRKESRSLYPLTIDIESHADNSRDVLSSIVWSDGRRSVHFDGYLEVVMKGPLPSGREERFHFDGSRLEGRRYLRGPWRDQGGWSTSGLMDRGDGDFRFNIRIREYESDPVTVEVLDGRPLKRSIEFQMPCTKAEALQSAPE